MKIHKAIRMPLRRSPQRPRSAASPLRARAATVDEGYDEEEDYGSEEEPNMKFTHALFVVLVLHIIAVGGVFAFNWMKTRQGAESAPLAKAPPAEKTVETAAVPKPEAPEKPAPAKPAPLDGWTGKTHTVQAGDTLIRIAAVYKTNVAAIEKENAITSYSLLRVGQLLKIPGGEKAVPAEAPKSSATKEAFLATKESVPPAPVPAAVGAVERIPMVESSAASGQKPVEKATEKPVEKPIEKVVEKTAAAPAVYVVVKGDNPYTIAKKLHVSYNELLSLNGIKDATKVQIGQKLKIPQS